MKRFLLWLPVSTAYSILANIIVPFHWPMVVRIPVAVAVCFILWIIVECIAAAIVAIVFRGERWI